MADARRSAPSCRRAKPGDDARCRMPSASSSPARSSARSSIETGGRRPPSGRGRGVVAQAAVAVGERATCASHISSVVPSESRSATTGAPSVRSGRRRARRASADPRHGSPQRVRRIEPRAVPSSPRRRRGSTHGACSPRAARVPTGPPSDAASSRDSAQRGSCSAAVGGPAAATSRAPCRRAVTRRGDARRIEAPDAQASRDARGRAPARRRRGGGRESAGREVEERGAPPSACTSAASARSCASARPCGTPAEACREDHRCRDRVALVRHGR